MEMPKAGSLTVVIVSWNVRDILLENLRTLFDGNREVNFRVVVVDNASGDGTVEAVRKHFPQVTVVENRENRGFAAAANQGIERADDGHVLLLNPDMRVSPGAIQKTIDYLDQHPDVAVLGPRLLDEAGKPLSHIRRLPQLSDQLVVVLKLTHLFPWLVRRYLAEDLDLEKEQEVESLRGAYFAINRTALEKIGALDDRYFIWFEEVDYCHRAKEAGMKIMYVPSIVARDLIGKSFGQRSIFWKQKAFSRSMIQYFEKWHPGFSALMIHLAWGVMLPIVRLADALGVRSPEKPKA